MKYKFDDGTYIMIDRSYINFSGIEYQIKENPYFKDSEHYKNGVCVRITKKGLKTLEENLNKLGVSVRSHGWSYEYELSFLSEELDRYLYFSLIEDIEPEIYNQIMTLIYVCPKCQGDKEKDHKLCGWCQIGGNPELIGTDWEVD